MGVLVSKSYCPQCQIMNAEASSSSAFPPLDSQPISVTAQKARVHWFSDECTVISLRAGFKFRRMHEKERPKASYQLPQGATLVASLGRAYRAGVAALGRRTPPFLQQIASYKRLGGTELFETPAANVRDLGFCKYRNSCGPSLPHRDAHNSRFAAENDPFVDRGARMTWSGGSRPSDFEKNP